MRTLTDAAGVLAFMKRIGQGSRGPGRVYLVGGSSAVLMGWRATTIDIDVKLDPEPEGAFEAIAEAKEVLNLNVETASPDDFMPALPGWRDRSRFIERYGEVDFFHYDFCAQALAKIERGLEQDRADVEMMRRDGLIEPDQLREWFARIEPELLRYPALDAATFRAAVDAAVARMR